MRASKPLDIPQVVHRTIAAGPAEVPLSLGSLASSLFSGRHLMSVRRTLVATALAPLVGLALAGCQEAEPSPKMPATSAASPTPTETETAEQESPEEFIRRWVAASNEMQITGRTSDYSEISASCQACRRFVERVDEVYAAGGYAEFDGATITKLVRVGKRPPTFDVSQTVPRTVIHHADGRVEEFPAGSTTIRVSLGRARGTWVVNHFGVL